MSSWTGCAPAACWSEPATAPPTRTGSPDTPLRTRRPQRRRRHHLVQRIHPCRLPQSAQPTPSLAGTGTGHLDTAHRRAYVFPGRHKRLFARFTNDEYSEVTVAAERFGLTPTGFCAHATLDAARNLHAGAAERIEH